MKERKDVKWRNAAAEWLKADKAKDEAKKVQKT
ncbi:hypothetical protein BH20PSE1_BH20PSE1_00810 [soil metagenome]